MIGSGLAWLGSGWVCQESRMTSDITKREHWTGSRGSTANIAGGAGSTFKLGSTLLDIHLHIIDFKGYFFI